MNISCYRVTVKNVYTQPRAIHFVLINYSSFSYFFSYIVVHNSIVSWGLMTGTSHKCYRFYSVHKNQLELIFMHMCTCHFIEFKRIMYSMIKQMEHTIVTLKQLLYILRGQK